MNRSFDDREALVNPSRRALVRALLAVPILGFAGCRGAAADAMDVSVSPSTLAPTLACGDDDDDPTPAQTEGPYFSRNSPQRASLIEAGVTGTRLVLAGQVLSTACTPITGALLDFWQADTAGTYDNTGYRLRGHQFTGGDGRFELETIVPGLYPGRTRHVHVKVQAPNRGILTTQLYFPGEARNATDGIYSEELLMAVTAEGNAERGTFNFVLAL